MKDSILESEHSIKEAIKTFKEKGLEELSKKESEILLSLMDTEYQNNRSPRGPYPKYEGKGYKGYPTFLDRGTNPEGTEHALIEVAKLPNGEFVDLNEMPKVKINEEYRKLFPELAKSLERDGLLQPVLIDDFTFTHDGEKRRLLLGLDQIKALGKLEIVPVNSDFSNISPKFLSNETKEVIIRDLHAQYINTFSNENGKYDNYELRELEFGRNNHAFVKMCVKRYGISKATVYRWIDPAYFEETEKKRLENKAKSDKSKSERKAKRDQIESEKSAKNEVAITNDSSIEYMLQWLDSENPKINDSEKNKLLALKDVLNRLLGVDS